MVAVCCLPFAVYRDETNECMLVVGPGCGPSLVPGASAAGIGIGIGAGAGAEAGAEAGVWAGAEPLQIRGSSGLRHRPLVPRPPSCYRVQSSSKSHNINFTAILISSYYFLL